MEQLPPMGDITIYVFSSPGFVRCVEHRDIDGWRRYEHFCPSVPLEHAEAFAVDAWGIKPTPYGTGVSFEKDVE